MTKKSLICNSTLQLLKPFIKSVIDIDFVIDCAIN